MSNADRILQIAKGEIGYHEGKNKDNKYGRWFGMNNCSWCVIFSAAWCYNQAGVIGARVGQKYKDSKGQEVGLYSCSQTLSWYKKNDPECISKTGVSACLVIFDFPNTPYSTDHMGLFVSSDGKTITTIDGNTSNSSEGNGGWVQLKTRKLSYANPIFIIPRELTLNQEEEMRYNTIKEIAKDAPWAIPTIEKLIKKGFLKGDSEGLDLSMDMIRMLVIEDRAGVYGP